MILIEYIDIVFFPYDYGKSCGELFDKLYFWFYLERFCKDNLVMNKFPGDCKPRRPRPSRLHYLMQKTGGILKNQNNFKW